MRIQGICKKYNIDFERVKKILLENGFNSLISSITIIDNIYLEFFEIEFRKDREKKEISNKMIENRKNNVLVNNGFPKYKNAISNYNVAYNKSIKAYHSAATEIKHIQKKIQLCSLQQKQYWSLNKQECELLINSKYEQIKEIVVSIEYILHSYDPENLYKYIEEGKKRFVSINAYNGYDYLNTLENSKPCSGTEEDDGNYLDDLKDMDSLEAEINSIKALEKEENYKSNAGNLFDDWNSYHNSNDNPWVNVFGMGDEAETAYWNTD